MLHCIQILKLFMHSTNQSAAQLSLALEKRQPNKRVLHQCGLALGSLGGSLLQKQFVMSAGNPSLVPVIGFDTLYVIKIAIYSVS
jgi:hypothetical protein